MTRMILGVVVALALASVGTAQSDCLFKEYDINDLASILRSEGYGSIEVLDQGQIMFKVEGRPYLLLLKDDGDLQMFCGFAGARLAYEDINEWNRKTRLNTAYIDAEQDPVMTSDLLANAGINEEIVKQFVGLFVHSFGPEFRRFVNERNRAR
ncbi:MAG: YbjN domain-containing protein [Acidobacteriota bacterium]